MKTLPVEWHHWVIECYLKGCDPYETISILDDNGFTFAQAKTAFGNRFPKDLTAERDETFYANLTTPKLIQEIGNSNAAYTAKVIDTEKAQLLQIDNFLDADTCTEIVRLAKQQLRPSTISAETGYEGFRTSSTCDLPYLKQAIADEVDAKIIEALGVGVGEKEIIQAQHYAEGQQFKAHTDYFEPGTEEYKTYAKDLGQRTWTFMVYLNSECEGGETEFINLGLKFKPLAGRALIWNNLYADGTPNPDTIHHAHPVTAGEKVVITKWFRTKNQ